MFRLLVLVVIAGLVAENIREVHGATDPPSGEAMTAQANTIAPPLIPIVLPCWTEWFDRDDPSGTGDWETLSLLRSENPGKICPNPLGIDVQMMNGVPGDVIYAQDTTTGFICRNQDQAPGYMCSDFRVRFRCYPPFCGGVCWTGWYDRDDPSGTGDWELLSYLRSENPGQICANPLYMEVVTKYSNIPALSTGEIFYQYNPVLGFVCRKMDQSDGACQDYKVRFGCAC